MKLRIIKLLHEPIRDKCIHTCLGIFFYWLSWGRSKRYGWCRWRRCRGKTTTLPSTHTLAARSSIVQDTHTHTKRVQYIIMSLRTSSKPCQFFFAYPEFHFFFLLSDLRIITKRKYRWVYFMLRLTITIQQCRVGSYGLAEPVISAAVVISTLIYIIRCNVTACPNT